MIVSWLNINTFLPPGQLQIDASALPAVQFLSSRVNSTSSQSPAVC